MEFQNIHKGSRIWHYVENGVFPMEFQILENIFNEQARKEGVLTEKQYIHLKSVDITENRVLNLNTELYKLLEN